jgi:GrpB-like predicted nucleotidyltransferase (UPF0157 family)
MDDQSDERHSHSGDEVRLGARESVDIVIVDYDPAWPLRFENERARIVASLGSRAQATEHVGSTSVAGLAAKPIVDICVIVADSSDEASYLPDLEQAGYVLRVREPEWHEHRMLRTRARDVHVHVFSTGTAEVDRMLLFRDWLRQHSDDRALYERTKRDLAATGWPTMQDYANAKTEVIESTIARARHGSLGNNAGPSRH